MTRKQLIKHIQTRLENEKGLKISKEVVAAIIEIEEDEVYMCIANEDRVNFSWGAVYGEERPPKRVGGKFAEYQTVIENHGYSSWKRGFPRIRWSRAALIDDAHSAQEYFELPEHRYTTKAREFRKIAKLPEIPEYEDLKEEEILELCKKADKIEFDNLPEHKKHRVRADDKSNLAKNIGSALYWEKYGIKPYHSFGKYYKGEQRDGITDYLDKCFYAENLELTLPQRLEIIRRALDMMEYKHLEDIHGKRLRKLEEELVDAVEEEGLDELPHNKIMPTISDLGRLRKGDSDYWGYLEDRAEFNNEVFQKYGINPLTAIEEYDAIYHQEDTLKPNYIERRNKERAEKAKKRQRKTQK